MAGNNFFVPTKQLWAARQASPGRPRKKLVPISSEKLQIEAKSQILTFNDFFNNFSEGPRVIVATDDADALRFPFSLLHIETYADAGTPNCRI